MNNKQDMLYKYIKNTSIIIDDDVTHSKSIPLSVWDIWLSNEENAINHLLLWIIRYLKNEIGLLIDITK